MKLTPKQRAAAVNALRGAGVGDPEVALDAVLAAVSAVKARGPSPADVDGVLAAEEEVRAGVSVTVVRKRYGLSGSVAQRLTRIAKGEA